MDQAGQNSSNKPDWLKNFGMPKNNRGNDALDRAIYAAKNQATIPQPSTNSTPASSAASSNQSLSAKEIINARYQSQSAPTPAAPRPTLSARDAINAARQKPTPKSDDVAAEPPASGSELISESAKPASRLHRGFIQKSMESTRPSASAILGTNSPDGEVPVVSTSLKLGANALPKKPVATLPPGARMARAAKPVDRPSAKHTLGNQSSVGHTLDDHPTANRPSAGKKLLNKISRSKPNNQSDTQIILPDQPGLSAGLAAGEVRAALGNSVKPARRYTKPFSGKVSQIPVMQAGERKIEVLDHEEPTTTQKSSPARRARQPLGISDKVAPGASISALDGAGAASITKAANAVNIAGAANRQLVSDPQMLSPDRSAGTRRSHDSRRSRTSRISQDAALARPHSSKAAKSGLHSGQTAHNQTTALSSPERDTSAKLGAAVLQALLDGSIAPETLGLQPSELKAITANSKLELSPSAVSNSLSAQSAPQPNTPAVQDSRAMKAALAGKTVEDLGVIEDYAPVEGRVKGHEAEVVSGAGLSARDPKNPKAHKAEDSRRTLGKQSPFFLKSVNVEKRPLSHDSAGIPAGPHRSPAEEPISPDKPVKLGTVRTVSHRSAFGKAPKPPKEKRAKDGHKAENRPLPDRPTVIVPSSHRSNAPLFFLLILTILLGAAVGAAAYLCFFQ